MVTIGIDVSKKKLDVYNAGTQEFTEVQNNEQAISRYVQQFVDQDVMILYEAT